MVIFVRERLDHVLLRGALFLGAVGGAFGTVSIPILAARADRLFWDGSMGYATQFPEDGDIRPESGASFTWDGQLLVTLDDPSTRLKLFSALPDVLVALSTGLVCALLLLILMDTHLGRPFLSQNVLRLRAVAAVIFAAAVLVPLAHAWANREVMTAAVAADPDFSGLFTYDSGTTLVWSFVALLVLAVAEAFRIGSQLADDVEGLV